MTYRSATRPPIELIGTVHAVADEEIIAFARRHAARPDLSIAAAKTLILGLAQKLEKRSKDA